MKNSSESEEHSDKVLLSHKLLVDELNDINQINSDEANPFNRRHRTERILVALMRFLINSVPYESGHASVDAINELNGALADTDNGKAAPLFEMKIKTPNRNTKHDEGLAYDLIIAARHYLIHTKKLKEGIAESEIEQMLFKNGILDINVDSIQRAHNRESARNSKRPDQRKRIINNDIQDLELDVIYEQIVKYLRHKSTPKAAPKI